MKYFKPVILLAYLMYLMTKGTPDFIMKETFNIINAAFNISEFVIEIYEIHDQSPLCLYFQYSIESSGTKGKSE